MIKTTTIVLNEGDITEILASEFMAEQEDVCLRYKNGHISAEIVTVEEDGKRRDNHAS